VSTHALLMPTKTPRSAFGKLPRAEATYAWRAPLGLLLGVAVPVLVLITLGLIPYANKPLKSYDGLTVFSVYFPALIVLALAVLALLSLPIHLASYCEQGTSWSDRSRTCPDLHRSIWSPPSRHVFGTLDPNALQVDCGWRQPACNSVGLAAATSASLGRPSRNIPIIVWRNYGKAEDYRDQSTRAEG
jgi:hypothetical protein